MRSRSPEAILGGGLRASGGSQTNIFAQNAARRRFERRLIKIKCWSFPRRHN
jgi:hypothetical protein